MDDEAIIKRTPTERYSGHESFVCRYGWLPKLYAAISDNQFLLKEDDQATTQLGIGRNMVRSIQFWGEAAGVIESATGGGHQVGQVGRPLFGEDGWDTYLEDLESLWLLHWTISTKANLAAWNCVFGSSAITRFTRKQLQEAVRTRAGNLAKNLAASTIEQHVSVFCSTYRQTNSSSAGSDDTLWSPFQDLGLLRQSVTSDGSVFIAETSPPIGLSMRVFAEVLRDYWQCRHFNNKAIRLNEIVLGDFSPGVVLRLDESEVRKQLMAIEDWTKGLMRLVDTADTQQVVVDSPMAFYKLSADILKGEEYV